MMFKHNCKVECKDCEFLVKFFPTLEFPYICTHPDGVYTQLKTEPYCKEFAPPIGSVLENCDLL